MLPKDQLEDLLNRAKSKFGVTGSLRKAGYLLPDGSMLDFSRDSVAYYGDNPYPEGYREHFDIEDLDDVNSIQDFLSKTCSARLVQEGYRGGRFGTITVEMTKGCEPTQAQLDVLRHADSDGYENVLFDVSDPEAPVGSYISVVSPPNRVALAINRAYRQAQLWS